MIITIINIWIVINYHFAPIADVIYELTNFTPN